MSAYAYGVAERHGNSRKGLPAPPLSLAIRLTFGNGGDVSQRLAGDQ
jgi:hypothetical protein